MYPIILILPLYCNYFYTILFLIIMLRNTYIDITKLTILKVRNVCKIQVKA